MKLYTRSFNKSKELKDFINEKAIKKDQIAVIFQEKDTTYTLMYYSDEE